MDPLRSAPTAAVDATEVALVIGPRFPLLSLAICTESLRIANRELGRPAFTHSIVSADPTTVISSSAKQVKPISDLKEVTSPQAVVVLSSYEPEAFCKPAMLTWLRRQDRRGVVIGCADTGAYVLARAGVLRGRKVAVHHETLPAYSETLGDCVLLDQVHAQSDGLLSSGGGMATADMMLDLIAIFEGQAITERIAYVLNYRRLRDEPARPNSFGDGAIARVDGRLGRMVEIMQSHLDSPLPLEAICKLAHTDASTARRLFLRRFGTTPGRYYGHLRLERARLLLAHSALQVGEIAAMAGFNDASAFARAYHRHYGRLPSQDRRAASGT